MHTYECTRNVLLGTALANEEVIDGRSERGSYPVFRKPLKQWMFRITAYAERLLKDLDLVKWPESTRTQQAEWIGRSEGAEIDFVIDLTSWSAAAPPRCRQRIASPIHSCKDFEVFREVFRKCFGTVGLLKKAQVLTA